MSSSARGVAAAFLCYILWGLFPLYWKLLGNVNAFEIVAHRIIWCFVFMAALCVLLRKDFLALLRQPRARRILIPAALVVTFNWSLYIFAVSTGHVVETSIGYYLNPLVTIVLGMVVFGERLRPLQWLAAGLCLAGIVLFTAGYGSFPWIAIGLAVSFAVYGAIKKKGGYPAIEAIAVENTVVCPLAIAAAVALAFSTGEHAFLGSVDTLSGWATTGLLVVGGVITAVPLVLFAAAANAIPLTILGFIQYVSPTIALLLGVLAFGEPFTAAHAVCFGLIWSGLALVAVDSVIHARKAATPARARADTLRGRRTCTGRASRRERSA